MSVSNKEGLDNLKENNENIPDNGCNVRWRINDVKNCSGSQEMFSDDDQVKDSPKISIKNDTLNSSTISLKTPILNLNLNDETPKRAAVPKTPSDLLPFITKTSLLWTSEMETPQGKLNDKSTNCDTTINSVEFNNTTPKRIKRALINEDIEETGTMNVITSPVFGGKKRPKKRVKRRILNIDSDNNNDQNSTSSNNSDRVSSEANTLASTVLDSDIKPEISTLTTVKDGQLLKKDYRENTKLEEAPNLNKNSNTSTQDFFCNASFSSIDQLCCNIIQEEKSNSGELNKKELNNIYQHCKTIKEEIDDTEENKSTSISNDVLQRVAAIRRNQKPIRRSTDISYVIIPKEEFYKSIIELELADVRPSQENKKTPIAQQKTVNLESNLSSIKNEIIIVNEKLSVIKKEIDDPIKDIPIDMDDWNVKSLKSESEKINLQNVYKPVDALDVNTDASFFKAKGKEITVNEKNFQRHTMIFEEIENEINSNSDFLTSGKSNLKSSTSICPVNKQKPHSSLSNCKGNMKLNNQMTNKLIHFDNNLQKKINGISTASSTIVSEDCNKLKKSDSSKKLQSNFQNLSTCKLQLITKINKTNENEFSPLLIKKCDEDKKSKTLKLYQDLDLGEFLEPKFTPEKDKYIKIKEEKEDCTSKVLRNIDVKKNISKLITDENLIENPTATSKIKLEPSSTEVTNIGFSTASGKGIQIDSSKENLYLKIYNELDDVDESNLLNIKKNKISKLNAGETSSVKNLVVFNKKKNVEIQPKHKNIESCSDFSDNGFSTAGGKGIKISAEKEKHYSKIFQELSDDIQDVNGFLDTKRKGLLNTDTTKKPASKTLTIHHEKKSITSEEKVSTNSDSDEAFYDLGDVEKLLVPPNQVKQWKTSEIDTNNCFTVPNATNVPKRIHQTSTAVQNAHNDLSTDTKKEVCIEEINLNKNEKMHNKISLSTIENQQNILDKENIFKNKHVNALKRKLDNCEVKRPERCRSFGGFPIKNESVSTSKMNKSHPNEDSFVNQPLQTGLSVSQCFDSHSDSWLSKVEISYLNNSSKIKSPEIKKEKKTPEKEVTATATEPEPESKKSEDCLGFSFKESTESFRRYASFKTYLKNQSIKNNDTTELIIESGKTISICNPTSSKQHLSVCHESNVEIQKNVNEPDYILVECKTKTIICELPKNDEPKVKEKSPVPMMNEKIIVKRKHADTDSDTPLTTLKKPRIGSELQGRKLFSDESDAEETNCNPNEKQPITKTPSPPLQTEQSFDQMEEEDLSEERINAIMQQEKMIRNKKRMKIKPTIGSLLKERLANNKNRISWTELVGDSVPRARNIEDLKENHIDIKILEVTASNAEYYKFLTSNYIGKKKIVSLDVGDGAVLIFDENGHAGVTEFKDAFTAMPGVDPKLVPIGWIENHYKWIVWKLASLDRIRFKFRYLSKVLTPERVMQELKYRYDREIDRAQRPALRKILEKDDVPTRRMVLCISSIKENTNNEDTEKEARVLMGLPRWKIEATDGWYSIPLTIDNALSNYVATGKIKEGTKIITYGAELLECERGFFPLDKPANVSLKLYTNCTRRARWDVKLGYQKNSRPIPVKLRNIIPSGGLIGETTAVAARVYPVLYREKTPSGQSIYRNARTEEKAAAAYECDLERKADAMYAEAEKKFDSKNISGSDSQGQANNRNYWEKREEMKQQLESQVRQGLPPKRQITPVLKIRLVDDRTNAILTIWGASEDSEYDIKEGSTITIYNGFAAGTRGGELHITASRITHIKNEPLIKLTYACRTCILIPNMAIQGFEPKFCEFDTVGVVVSTGPAPYGMKNFEMVNLAYPNPNSDGSSYLSILFWNGVSSFGYQGIFTVGSFVACSNLEWRRNTSWSIAVAYCSEKTVFTCNPRQSHTLTELRKLKALVQQNPVTYAENCAEEVASELSKKPQPRSNQGTPTSWSDRGSFYNNTSIVSPMDTFSSNNVAIQRRLEKLSRYGSTTEISPIVLNNSSSRVNKDFTPVTVKRT